MVLAALPAVGVIDGASGTGVSEEAAVGCAPQPEAAHNIPNARNMILAVFIPALISGVTE
jgi:hypothetical protein